MKALFVAAELGVFQSLEETDGRPGTIAKSVGASPDRLEILLNALTSLGFIRKNKQGKFRNTASSREWLTSEGVHSMVENLRTQEFLSGAYAGFLDTVRRGRPRRSLVDLLERDPAFVAHYINGMSEVNGPVSRELSRVFNVSFARDMLDVGGGPGLFSLAFLERNPRLRAVVLDLPETLVHTRRYAADSPVGGRVSFQSGDYHKVDFGRNCYDFVLMSHVTHDEGVQANRLLIGKAYRALRPGGRLVIHDFMVNREKTGPLFSALFSVHLAVYTESGRTYSEEEYAGWLKGAGFTVSRPVAILPELPNSTRFVVGRKKQCV